VDDRTLQLPPLTERRPQKARVPAVILYDGDEIGGLHSLTKDETIIGRTAGCDIVIPETRVSRRHAMIRRTQPGGDEFEIVDLGSTNGTFLEGAPVRRAVLQNGDKVGIGGRILSFSRLDQADLAYQSRIVQMIHVDELTGLLTKRSLFRALEMELIRAQRYRHPVSVLMMDLDHFKLVNDTYGHLVGSDCLAEVGKLIRESTRETDVSGRYGGEEFVTFLPESDSPGGLIVAERVRTAMEERVFRYGELTYRVQISIGIATWPSDGNSVESLVHAADTALYRAKNTGRNRCVIFTPDLPQELPAVEKSRPTWKADGED
jgi:diguanylate cyclase (GGDEF)-like protein